MLTTNHLHIDGRHHTLLPATTLEARRGELLLVQADGQERRTALALALTGRMKPDAGSVALGHDDSLAGLRRRSAIVDAPDVNAPEHHLTVRSLAAEDLALVPVKFRDRTRPTEWLVRNGFSDILKMWIEEVEPGRLLHLQLALAIADQGVELVVVDSPDRHTSDDDAWLPLLTRLAAGELHEGPGTAPDAEEPPRPLMVVGVVARFPTQWDGPAVVAGEAAAAVGYLEAETAAETVAVPVESTESETTADPEPGVEPDPDAGVGPDVEAGGTAPEPIPEHTVPIPEVGTTAADEEHITEAGESK